MLSLLSQCLLVALKTLKSRGLNDLFNEMKPGGEGSDLEE